MTAPEVSVIVPVFNAGEYLEPCIRSILASTYADFELILVDDGSTDASGAVCDDFADADSRVRVIHTPNRGVSSARNTAIDVARGRYLVFVDADDVVSPLIIGRLHSMITDTTPIAVVGIAMGESNMPGLGSTEYETRRTKILNGLEAARRLLHQKNYLYNPCPCGKMFARSLFEDIRFRAGRFEDLDLIPRLFVKAGRIVFDNTELYFYRQHPAAFSHIASPARLDALAVTADLEIWGAALSPTLYSAARDRRFSAAFNVFNIVSTGLLGDAPDGTADQCWKIIKERRRQVLTSRHARLKNRLGAALSYFGRRFMTRIAARMAR